MSALAWALVGAGWALAVLLMLGLCAAGAAADTELERFRVAREREEAARGAGQVPGRGGARAGETASLSLVISPSGLDEDHANGGPV